LYRVDVINVGFRKTFCQDSLFVLFFLTSTKSFEWSQLWFDVLTYYWKEILLRRCCTLARQCTGSEFFIYQLMHNRVVLRNIKIDIKIDIKTAPTCFGAITIIRERIIWALLKLQLLK
jgi:hypothetical protein